MPDTTEDPNPHRDANRIEKVRKLVAEIDARAVAQDLDPQEPETAKMIAARVTAQLTDVGWIELAQRAGCNVPSAKTRGLVAMEYVRRSLASLVCGRFSEDPAQHGETPRAQAVRESAQAILHDRPAEE